MKFKDFFKNVTSEVRGCTPYFTVIQGKKMGNHASLLMIHIADTGTFLADSLVISIQKCQKIISPDFLFSSSVGGGK